MSQEDAFQDYMGAVLPDPFDMRFDTNYKYGVAEYDKSSPIVDYMAFHFEKDIIEDPE